MDSKWITGRIVFRNTHILALMLSTRPQSIRNARDLTDSSLAFGAEDISYSRPFFEVY
jgi:hypothetical protein